MFCTYILQSEKTRRYYVGSTSDLVGRIKRHNAGRNISTRADVPWKLVYSEEWSTKQEAYRREFQIKRYKGREAFLKLVGK